MIDLHTLGLAIRSVLSPLPWPLIERKSKPLKILQELGFEARFGAFYVGIFDS
jgi:hypothetical protein